MQCGRVQPCVAMSSCSNPVDAAKAPVMLSSLRLPSINRLWQEIAGQADSEGWGALAIQR